MKHLEFRQNTPLCVVFLSLLGVSSGDETRRLMLYILGSFSNDDGDGNEDVKKAIGFARASSCFVNFFTVLARLRCENA